MKPNPLRTYVAGIRALDAGKKDDAARLVAESFGAGKPTKMISQNIDALADGSEVALVLITARSKKSGR